MTHITNYSFNQSALNQQLLD